MEPSVVIEPDTLEPGDADAEGVALLLTSEDVATVDELWVPELRSGIDDGADITLLPDDGAVEDPKAVVDATLPALAADDDCAVLLIEACEATDPTLDVAAEEEDP